MGFVLGFLRTQGHFTGHKMSPGLSIYLCTHGIPEEKKNLFEVFGVPISIAFQGICMGECSASLLSPNTVY